MPADQNQIPNKPIVVPSRTIRALRLCEFGHKLRGIGCFVELFDRLFRMVQDVRYRPDRVNFTGLQIAMQLNSGTVGDVMQSGILRTFATAAALVAGIAALTAAAPAVAADMPAKASMYTKAPAVSADPWTGWYLGMSAGGRFDNDKWTATGFESPPVGVFLTSRDNPHEFSLSSARLGLYGGYNWRLQQMWVVGLEADFAWANKSSSIAGIPGLNGTIFPQTDSTAVKNMWDGGVRGRLGYLVTPVTLLYATGGVSWMKSEASVTCGGFLSALCSGTNWTTARTDSVSKTVVGWSLGGGLETMIVPNWFLRGEYRYTSYASYHASLLRDGGSPTPADNEVDADIKIRTHTALIGLAYKFGQ